MSGSTENIENSYDEVPYNNRPCTQSHVRRLEAVATLFGTQPKAITQARILEIGCAAGHNLIPQAEEFPASSFVGFDLSQRQIREGQGLVQKLGLANIELRHASITDVDSTWGQFDYIICHGVYSWVPPAIQARILDICTHHLAPRGVAHISYNLLPGWHMRSAVRDMLQFHVARVSGAREKIAQARAWLAFLVDVTPQDAAYGRMLQDELKLVQTSDDSYLFHEHLEEFNQPLYFQEFARRLATNKLQFLGEVSLASMLSTSLPPAVQEKLAGVPLIEQQQYLDFVRNRAFRESLVCHANVPLVRRLTPAVMEQFHVWPSGEVKVPAADLASTTPTPFVFGGVTLTVVNPLVKAALVHLMEAAPQAVSFGNLFAAALERLPASTRSATADDRERQRTDLAATLLLGVCNGIIDFAVHAPAYASRVSQFPEAPPLARSQAAQSDCVTNRRHEHIQLDAVCCHVLHRLDGSHTVDDLAASLRDAIQTGAAPFGGKYNAAERISRDDATGLVGRALTQMARRALLVR